MHINDENKIATDRDGTVTAQMMDDRLDAEAEFDKKRPVVIGDNQLMFGSGHTPRPFINFPPGRVRIRQRVNGWVTAYIKTPHGIREFVVTVRDELWFCDAKYEMGSNLRDSREEPDAT